MHLGADMVCDKAHDALAIARRQVFARIDKTARQPIDPEAAIGIEHALDYFGVFQEQREGGTECSAQHAGAARSRFLIEMVDCHLRPQPGGREMRS
jgi:hypothetical protein